MRKIKVDTLKIARWHSIAKRSPDVPVFYGKNVLELIELVQAGVEITEASMWFLDWVNHEGDRDQSYVAEYYRRLDKLKAACNKFHFVKPS